MSTFYEGLQPLLSFTGLCNSAQVFSETLLQTVSRSMATTSCGGTEAESCRDDTAALHLKFMAVAAILVAGVVGVAIPLVGKRRKFLRTDSNLFVAAKAFAAGVILATGFVHMLPDGMAALTDSCLPEIPWSKFPFSGFVAMMASLATLVADFLGTQFYERKHDRDTRKGETSEIITSGGRDISGDSGLAIVPLNDTAKDQNGKVFGAEEGGVMHIVGIHAHAASHRHSHPHEQGACDEHRGHSHRHGPDGDTGASPDARHVVVSQILELGIVSHSVIIGLSLGVSQRPCTIRPLIAALSFHQFFEGFALGGCISQAQFKTFTSTLMAFFFAITTPTGVGLGVGIASFYNPDSPRALVVEGIFDSISAGILVYMALVDLIAADFLSKRMSCNVRLQVVSYFALFLGAGMMSALAIWA